MDFDLEAWSPVPLSPSPLRKQRPRLIAGAKENSQLVFERLDGSVPFFETPGTRKVFSNRIGRNRRLRLQSTLRTSWIPILVIGCICYWLLCRRQSERMEVEVESLSEPDKTQQLQFFSANNENIRYVGRWTAVEDSNRTDGSFPGVYFDIAVVGTRTVMLSLHNRSPISQTRAELTKIESPRAARPSVEAEDNSHPGPISLLAMVDEEEYIVLPKVSSIVRIRYRDLDPTTVHSIRIIAPMVDTGDPGMLGLNGICLDTGGALIPTSSYANAEKGMLKTLETVTDSLNSRIAQRSSSYSPNQAILGGVLGWQYLVGEMFGADHIRVGVEGMCLIQDCIGGKASPAGLSDVFFQSGPFENEHFSQPWLFQAYVPDVMVMNLGNADWHSFETHLNEYKKTSRHPTAEFEDTYVRMIKAIRALAYPSRPTTLDIAGEAMFEPRKVLPIFVMRPFRGQLEQAIQRVVNRLRLDGDMFVFWLDTTGWLSTEIDLQGNAEDQDFSIDEDGQSKEWRLTERGNRRVAMLLHMHVCRYLATDPDRCAIRPSTPYDLRSGV